MAARALSTYSLASLEQTRRACGVLASASPSEDVTNNLMDAIEWASDEVERFLCRELVTRGNRTEYHSGNEDSPSILRLRQYPILSIVSIDEGYWDTAGWTSSETLAANEDYLREDSAGILRRVSTGALTSWPMGHEKVRVVYTAGYATTATVPDTIRRVALTLAGRRYAELVRGQPGAQSMTDGMGAITRFLPAELMKMEEAALGQFVRFNTTGRAA